MSGDATRNILVASAAAATQQNASSRSAHRWRLTGSTEASARRAAFAFRVRKEGNNGANAIRVDYASTSQPVQRATRRNSRALRQRFTCWLGCALGSGTLAHTSSRRRKGQSISLRSLFDARLMVSCSVQLCPRNAWEHTRNQRLRNAATDFGPAQRRLATTIQKLGWRAAPFTAVMRFARWVHAIIAGPQTAIVHKEVAYKSRSRSCKFSWIGATIMTMASGGPA